MKKPFLIILAILLPGLYSLGGTYYGPNNSRNFLYINNEYGEDDVNISSTVGNNDYLSGAHYYLKTDIFNRSSYADIDIEAQLWFRRTNYIYLDFLDIAISREGRGNYIDIEYGVIPELDSGDDLMFTWLYTIRGGSAYMQLFCLIY